MHVQHILPTELDCYLSQFVLAARTNIGKDYEPSVIYSRDFRGKAVVFRASELKIEMNSKRNKRNLSDKHVKTEQMPQWLLLTRKNQILFEKKLLGLSCIIMQSLVISISSHPSYTTSGSPVKYFEGKTKTRTEEDPRNQQPVKPRIYANNPLRQ